MDLTSTVIETAIALNLSELESIIEDQLRGYVEIGTALSEISERRLYRDEGYGTFEDYCDERWCMARRTAYAYVQASTVSKNVHTCAQTAPSLSQAREMFPLSPEQQREVASRVDFSKITVRELKDLVRRLAGPLASNVHFSSESEEWYTPPEIISRVVETLGSIDLDPCSDAGGNVPASTRFTKADDGLAQQWGGRVYMNPPYGRAILGWSEKLCSEYARGNVQAAVALVPARVDTDWFRLFRDFAVCFIDGRLKFSGHENSAPFPSAVIYLGPNIEKFDQSFGDVGDVWIRWKP